MPNTNNPFSLIFGLPPHLMISRLKESDLVLSSFTNEVQPTPLYLITGVRGAGKTVLMTDIARKIASDSTWLTLELNPELDLVQSFYEQLSAHNSLREIIKRSDINLSLPGIGLSLNSNAPTLNLITELAKMLGNLKKHRRKVLILIDEATNSPYMRVFAHTFDILLRQQLPVFLLMTGLQENLRKLQNEQSLTFLLRAPRIILKPLTIGAICDSYQTVLNIDSATALAMAKLTRGYSYAYQLLGYLYWENPGDYHAVIPQFRQYLTDYVYEKIWSELSHKDRKVAVEIARSEDGKIASIRAALNLNSNSFTPYRQRLINRGLVNGDERGYLRFTLPLFERFVLEDTPS